MKKNLTLSIKQEYFDEILAGTKKTESREIRFKNVHKYCEVDENRDVFYDKNDNIITRKYDTLTLYTGAYKGKRAGLIVEVLGSNVVVIVDENNEVITYKETVKVNGKLEEQEFIEAWIEYHLGKVLETINF